MEWSNSQVSALADLITGQTLDGVVVEVSVCVGGRGECKVGVVVIIVSWCLLQQSGLSGYPLVQLSQRGESDDVYSQLVRTNVMDAPRNRTSKDSYPREGGRRGEQPVIDKLSAPEEEPKILPELPQEGGQESSDMELAEVQTLELD